VKVNPFLNFIKWKRPVPSFLVVLMIGLLSGCGGASADSPTGLANAFMKAVLAGDLSKVQSLYSATGRQETWDDVFHAGFLADDTVDVKSCAGVSHHVEEHEAIAGEEMIDFVYDTPCLNVTQYIEGNKTARIVSMDLERINGHWFVNYVELPELD
jgi:hypothetical protein